MAGKQPTKNLERFFTKYKLAKTGSGEWMREIFTQYFHFITAFKRKFGTTPKRYLNSFQ